MRKIKNIEKIENEYGEWKPADVAFVKSFASLDEGMIIAFYCQARSPIGGWPDISKDFFEVHLRFSHVSNLKIKFHSVHLQQISGFNIIDISGDGFEKINFQIEDYENGVVSFNCEDIEVLEISGLKLIPEF